MGLGVVDDVRTFDAKRDNVLRIANEVRRTLDTDEGRQILQNIRSLRDRFEPEALAKDASPR